MPRRPRRPRPSPLYDKKLRVSTLHRPQAPFRCSTGLRTEYLGQPRLQTTVVTLFGLATLLLTLVGLYARVAHGVAIRSREFAIRKALGARPTDVVRQLTGDALVVVAVGVVIGLALLPLSTRALRSLVIDAPALDFGLAAGVACLLGLGALASAYWPARRAGRVDPAQLLKAEH